jgi:mannose-6-phosphate isomerase-like protein (cupin superfamily)
MTSAVKVPYRVNLQDLPEMHVTPPSQDAPSTLSVKMAYGTDTGIMVAQRHKGYHSRPHQHDSEQWNYVLDGEIWFFIDQDGFRCVKGDIVRVPRNLVHWTWVRATQGCLMVETHTPQLTGDPDLAKRAYAMGLPGEDVDPAKGVNNIWVDYPQSGEIERRAVAADPD